MRKKVAIKILLYFVVLVLIYIFAYTISFAIVKFSNRFLGIKTEPQILQEEDWVYSVYESGGIKSINIIGITDSGKEKKILVAPSIIDGIKVSSVTYSLDYCSAKIDNDKLKTVYLKGGASIYKFSKANNLKKFIVINSNYDVHGKGIGVDYGLTNIYICRDTLDYATGKVSGRVNLYYANVSFMYNYEGAGNGGVYWLDNYDYRQKIGFIPENPVREGYTFGGWFKEEACENEWKFTIDRLPYKKVDQFGETLYQETRLYAKWIVNE